MNTTIATSIAALLSSEIDPAFAARASLILQQLESVGAGSILDLGCGRGFYAKAITTLYPGGAVAGVDYNADYLAAAKAQTYATTVRLARADARALPFPSESFDAVVCSEVLEHIVDDGAALLEINRVLRDGGLLLISVPHQNYPFLWDPLNWVLEHTFGSHVPAHIWWLAGIWADHVRLYTATELSSRVRTAGFVSEATWFTTPRCLPFAHFLLYGIGKNIIESGLCPTFNRFGRKSGRSRFLAWALRLLYAFDDPVPARSDKTPSVGIVIKARKQA